MKGVLNDLSKCLSANLRVVLEWGQCYGYKQGAGTYLKSQIHKQTHNSEAYYLRISKDANECNEYFPKMFSPPCEHVRCCHVDS